MNDANLILRKKPKVTLDESGEPEWVSTGTKATRKLFNAARLLYDDILSKIEANEELSVSQRRLASTGIAKLAGYDKSLISKRRQPDLVD